MPPSAPRPAAISSTASGRDGGRRGASLLVTLGNDADDVTLTHDHDQPWNLPRGRVIHRAELRAASGWPHHRAVRHARETYICHERGSSGHDLTRLKVWRR